MSGLVLFVPPGTTVDLVEHPELDRALLVDRDLLDDPQPPLERADVDVLTGLPSHRVWPAEEVSS